MPQSQGTAENAQERDARTGPALAPGEFPLPERDVRSKRPPMLSFLLRMDTLRQAARVLSLLALDFIALFGAILTALCLKAAVRDAWNFHVSFQQTKDYFPLVYLVTVLLFARSGLYTNRAERPGLARIVAGLFQTMVLVFVFAVVNGNEYSSYYIFYGSLFFAVAYVTTLRFVYERVTGLLLRAAGYQRRTVLVGTGEHIEDVASALRDGSDTSINVIGFVSITPRPDNGLVSLGTLENVPEVLETHRVDEVIIADPDFPQQQAVELVDQCHQRGVTVRIAPSTMEILVHRAEFVPGQSVPLFELRPPVFEGIDYMLKRTFDVVGAVLLLVFLSPAFLAIAIAIKVSSRGSVFYGSIRPGIGGQTFSCLEVPHDVPRRRPASGGPRVDQRGQRRAVQDQGRPADDARRPGPAALLARRAAAAVERRARRDVAGRPAAAAPARLRAPRGLAQEALPRAPRHHRPVAGLRPLGARFRRPRAARFPLPRALVGVPRPHILVKTVPAVFGRRGAF